VQDDVLSDGVADRKPLSPEIAIDPDLEARTLAHHATEIRKRVKCVRLNVYEIGRRLTDAKSFSVTGIGCRGLNANSVGVTGPRLIICVSLRCFVRLVNPK
jgi:hypothetical protein